MKYKAKPCEIEAIQWLGTAESFKEIKKMIGSNWLPGEMGTYSFLIKTLDGNMKANKYDYIIKGLKDEFYPCKPDVFELKYELV